MPFFSYSIGNGRFASPPALRPQNHKTLDFIGYRGACPQFYFVHPNLSPRAPFPTLARPPAPSHHRHASGLNLPLPTNGRM